MRFKEIYKWTKENNMQFKDKKFQALPTNRVQSEYAEPGSIAIPGEELVCDVRIPMSGDA